MLRLRLVKLLKERGMTPYALAKASGISLPHVYALVKAHEVGRISGPTIEALCRALRVQPGDLFEYREDEPAPRRRP
jgi:DNA-binding Xre family transcriptional regulator